ncbi:MAG: EamA family transporter [Fluviibacter sp.]
MQWAPEFVLILLVLAFVSTAFCWWLWTSILDRVPAWEASLLVLGTPVIAIASSRVILDEAFSCYEVAGIVLIGAGLLLLSLDENKSHESTMRRSRSQLTKDNSNRPAPMRTMPATS